MKVIGRDNQVKNGFLHFPAFLQTLLGELTDEAIAKAIPDEKIKKIKRVIITGNGDSYAACLAT